ncbi:MAG: CxxC-x17-CxxC domain-containing protein [archaeon]
MGNFSRDSGRSSGRSDRRGSRDSGRSDRRESGRFSSGGRDSDRGGRDRRSVRGTDQRFFEVTCDKCHKQCEVPFKPTSDKPVYCSDCFRQTEGRSGGDSRSSGSRDRNGGSSRTLEEINQKLDKIIKALDLD